MKLPVLIRRYAFAHGLDPIIVAALIYQESKGDIWAARIEQTSKIWFTLMGRNRQQMAGWCPRPGELPELWDEACWRASSFGLMQILGETARVLGFTGRYLPELHDPDINLTLGCRYLAQLLNRAKKETAIEFEQYNRALMYYNGSNKYPALVRSHIGTGRAEGLLNN